VARCGSHLIQRGETSRCSGRERCVAVLLALLLAAARVLGGESASLSDVDCARLALARAPEVAAAVFEVDGAAARVREAHAAYVPRLLAQGEYGVAGGFDEQVTNGGSTAALLTLEATLLDGGLRQAQLAAARANLHGTMARAQQRRADLVLEVRTAYFVALARRAELAIDADALEALRGWVAWLRAQQEHGLIPGDDAARAQLAVTAVEAGSRSAEAELRNACDQLESLTGTVVSPAVLAPPSAIAAVAVASPAIDASPVLADARAAVEAARHDVEAVQAEQREKLNLTASAGALGVQPGPTFRDHGGGQFLLGVRVPLFDAAAAPRLAGAIAAQHEAEANLERARRSLTVALSRARVDAERAEADVATWRRAAPAAADSFLLLRARYVGGGNVRLIEVLDALNQSVEARLNLERALLSQRLSIASEHQIIGDATP